MSNQSSLLGVKPQRPKRPPPRFSIADCMAFASAALLVPPARPHIVRAAPVGKAIWQCVLPLEFCPPINVFKDQPVWMRTKNRRRCRQMMLAQHGIHCQEVLRRTEPLPGRPMVRAIRFSSVECDAHNGWTKIPIDRLTGKHGGLGFLVDDRPTCVDLHPWWEPAPRGRGFCLIEVWSGETKGVLCR